MPNVVPDPAVSARRPWLLSSGALTLAFGWPLAELARFAFHSGLYSHILLVPFVSMYLIWHDKNVGTSAGRPPPRLLAAIPCAAAMALLVWWQAATRLAGDPWLPQDRLALAVTAWWLLVVAASLRFLDAATLRRHAFPLAFLVFMVPLPTAAEAGLETVLQHGSAFAARIFFKIAGTPFFYEDLTFRLPGFNMHVAPECSGIHSSLVLFITSTLAAHLFLRSPGHRAVLVLSVVPLALLRNGFRAFVIGELCVHIGPEMSDTWIHHQGGPVFFVLSLIPLFLLLFWLLRSERRKPNTPANTA